MEEKDLFDRHDDDDVCLTWGQLKRYRELKKMADNSLPGLHEIFPSKPTALVDAMNFGWLPKKTRVYRNYLVVGKGKSSLDVSNCFHEDAEVDEFIELEWRIRYIGTGSILYAKRMMKLELAEEEANESSD